MADDERRAEIEAIERALRAAQDHMRNTPGIDPMRSLYAREIRDGLEALDRVRDARGDDEALPVMDRDWQAKMAARGDDEAATGDDEYGECGVLNPGWQKGVPARSPQGEDHEAGLEEATRTIFGTPTRSAQRQLVGEAIAAYLSRVSPSRDGSGAEDVLRWAERTGRLVTARGVREFLAEFSPASTGDREEKKA